MSQSDNFPGYGPQVPVVSPGAGAGMPGPAHLMAPIGNGSSVSSLPLFGGAPPLPETGNEQQHKLGLGDADPTVHGGGG